MSRAGWSPVGVKDGRHLEIAVSVISTRLLEIISTDLLEMEEVQGNGHFQISKVISADMAGTDRVNIVGALSA
jgi:hypothetical protein